MMGLLSFFICLLALCEADVLTSKKALQRTQAEIRAAHFLNQATLGARPQEVRALGGEIQNKGEEKALKGWLADQFTRSSRSLAKHYQQYIIQHNEPIMGHEWYRRQDAFWWDNALKGSDELRKRVTWALSQILIASAKGVPAKTLGGLHYYDTLSLAAFEDYETLLQSVTYSPVMGKFLNSAKNAKATKKRFANENYARELLQLFSLGMYQRGADGRYILDSNGQKQENYTIADVKSLSRILTGLNYVNMNGSLPKKYFKIRPNMHASMQMDQRMHDTGEKVFLGETFPPDGDGAEEIKRALHLIVQHPSTAVHISIELIKKLTTSNPSEAYITRVTEVWKTSSGNLQQVVAAILLDPEARSSLRLEPQGMGKNKVLVKVSSKDPRYGRLKEPVLMLSQFYRCFGAETKPKDLFCPAPMFARFTHQRPLYQQSVFNDFNTDYTPQSGPVVTNQPLASQPLVLPEFELLSLNMLSLERAFLRQIRQGKVSQIKPYQAVPLKRLARLRKKETPPQKLMHWLNLYCCHGSIPISRQREILGQAESIKPYKKRVDFIVHRVISSADYAVIY